MYPPYKEGDDVTSLINGVSEGDDVTSLINGSGKNLPKTNRPMTLQEKQKSIKAFQGARDAIDEPLLPENITGKHEPESYWGGFGNSLYKDFVRPLSSPLNILGATTLGGGEGKGKLAGPEVTNLPESELPKKILGLPPATGMEVKRPRFIAGDKGIAEANKSYPMDIAPANPRLGQTDAGTILPRETEGITQLPGPQAARIGTQFGDIPKIETSSLGANTESLDKIRQGSPVQLSKVDLPDTTGGIQLPEIDSPYQTPSAVREPKTKPQALDATEPVPGNTTVPEQGSSSAVAKNSSNKIPSEGVPPPGAATSEIPPVQKGSISKDVNAIRSEVGSVDRTLSSRPETAGISAALTTAQDTKAKWIAETMRSMADITKGLGRSARVQLGNMLNGSIDSNANPDLIARATKLREALDSIWKQIPGAKTDPQVGFIENYLTHIEKDDTGAKQVWENYFKKPFQDIFSSAPLEKGNSNSLGDMYERGLGNPNSPFVKTRTGALKDIELDTNKVLPAYVESIAKLIHDKPAVDAAKAIIAKLPNEDIYGQPSRLKDLAEWYVKNYTHYDANPALGNVWTKYTNAIMRTTARSMLGFSTGLQTLHLARIPMNLYPELGERYLLHGAAQVIKNPKAAYQEAASLGLLQNEVKPFAFKTLGEKTDSIIGFFQAADFLDKSIGYHGFKQKFIDAGMSVADASMKAIAASKRASLTIDPSRSIRAFNPEPGLVGSVAKLSSQFKQVPVKIIEQYVSIAAATKENPKMAARAVVGVSLAAAAAEAGFHTLHVSPKQFALDAGGASFSVMKDIYREVIKGDLAKALGDTALFLTPGGRSIKRQINSGLSMFDKPNQDIPMPR